MSPLIVREASRMWICLYNTRLNFSNGNLTRTTSVLLVESFAAHRRKDGCRLVYPSSLRIAAVAVILFAAFEKHHHPRLDFDDGTASLCDAPLLPLSDVSPRRDF